MKELEQVEEQTEDVSTESQVEWKEDDTSLIGTTETTKPSVMEIIKAVGKAVKDGTISPQQAQEIRRDLGVSQGTFTRSKPSADERKKRRTMQKLSRRANRHSGNRGR